MTVPPKRIPIKAAREYGQRFGQNQVIILSFGDDGVTHVVTWGKTKKDCEQAAAGSKKITDSLGITTKRT